MFVSNCIPKWVKDISVELMKFKIYIYIYIYMNDSKLGGTSLTPNMLELSYSNPWLKRHFMDSFSNEIFLNESMNCLITT